MIEDLLEEINGTPHSDDILEVLDSQEQFLDALVTRIAFQPVFKNVRFHFTAGDNLPLIRLQKDRFCDALAGILEEIATVDIKEISLLTARYDEGIVITVSVPGGIPEDVLNEKKLKLYRRKFSILGGGMDVEKDGQGQAFLLKLFTEPD